VIARCEQHLDRCADRTIVVDDDDPRTGSR
jgi:hypothetical protein